MHQVRQLVTRADIGLGVDVAEVVAHRALGDEQVAGDLGLAEAFGDKREHVAFPIRQGDSGLRDPSLPDPAQLLHASQIGSGTKAVLLVAGIGGSVLAVQESSEWGWGSARTLAILGVGLPLTSVFVLSQLRESQPIVAVRMLVDRAFAGNIGVGFTLQFGLLAAVLFSSLYVQNLLHYSPVVAGVSVLPFLLPITLAAQVGGRWYDRCGRASAGTDRAGALPARNARPHHRGADHLLLAASSRDAADGACHRPHHLPQQHRNACPQRRRAAGQASGLSLTFRQLGGTLGVAVLGTIVISYQHSAPAPGVSLVQHSANAITVGFAAATGVFGLALAFGWYFLPRQADLASATSSGELGGDELVLAGPAQLPLGPPGVRPGDADQPAVDIVTARMVHPPTRVPSMKRPAVVEEKPPLGVDAP